MVPTLGPEFPELFRKHYDHLITELIVFNSLPLKARSSSISPEDPPPGVFQGGGCWVDYQWPPTVGPVEE